MAKEDVLVTTQEPHWQTEWDTEYIQDEEKEKFSLKTCDGELVGLVAYEIRAKYVCSQNCIYGKSSGKQSYVSQP